MSGEKPAIFMIATRVPIEPGDGTPSFVLDGAIALANDFKITILAPRLVGSPYRSMHGGVTVVRHAYFPQRWERLAEDAILPRLRKEPRLVGQALALGMAQIVIALSICLRERPDIIHAHWMLPSGLTALIVSRILRIPFIVTSHGADTFGLEARPMAFIKRTIARGSSAFVGVSREIVERYGVLAPKRIQQPVGADFEKWSRLVPQREPIEGRILFVGRLDKKKGTDLAIRALRTLKSAHLRIVGEGPERERLERLTAELGLGSRVTFLGRLSTSALALEYCTASCIVIPSVVAPGGDRDGTPAVFAEAVATAVPVVAARIAGVADYLIDNIHGFLFHPGDEEQLAERVHRMLGNPRAAERLARRAQVELRPHLDAATARRSHANLYREIIANAG